MLTLGVYLYYLFFDNLWQRFSCTWCNPWIRSCDVAEVNHVVDITLVLVPICVTVLGGVHFFFPLRGLGVKGV